MSRGEFELYVEEGPERGRFISLTRHSVKIGRRTHGVRAAETVTLNDPTLSAHHATLEWESERGRFRLLHHSQTNATLVNGRPVEEVFLTPNDTIQMGRVVLRLLERQTLSGRLRHRRSMGSSWRLRAEDRIMFFYNLSVMLASGLPMARSMEALVNQAEHPQWQAVLDAMLQMLHNGAPLSMCMAAKSPPFTTTEMALVRAGELSGKLPEVLRATAETRQKELELVRRVRSSLTYPVLVLAFGVVVILLLGRVAFSALVPMLEGTGAPLPAITQVLITVSRLLGTWWVVLPVLAGVALLGDQMRRYLATARGVAWRDRFSLRLWLVGPLLTKVAAARFCYSLSQLYASGLNILPAFREAARSCGNVYVAGRLDTLSNRLKDGQTLSECLSSAGLMPWSMLSLVDVGETTGALDHMLDRAAAMLDEDVNQTLEQAVKALEPCILAVMGVLVGGILVAAFLPIYAVVSRL